MYNPALSSGFGMSNQRGRSASGRKKVKARITKLGPGQPAARDEGPRLLPLRRPQDPPKLEHWVDLADTVLRPSTKKKGAGQE